MSRIVKLVWIAGLVTIIALVLWSGPEPVRRAFETVGWQGAAGVSLLRGLAVASAGAGWFVLFPRVVRPSILACVLIRFLREGANALLPVTQIGGEVIGARAMILRGAPAPPIAASIIVDVLVQAATQFLFAAVGVATLAAAARTSAVGGTVAVVIAVAVPALGGFYYVQQPAGQRLVKAFIARVLGERAWLPFGAIDALYSSLGSIYANRAGLLGGTAIHMSVWAFGALEVWLILALMGFPASYPEALIVESLLQAIRGAAFAVPGALGAQEGGLVAICALFGLPADAAIAMSLIKRVPDLVFGAPSLLGWQMLEGWALLAKGGAERRPSAAADAPSSPICSAPTPLAPAPPRWPSR